MFNRKRGRLHLCREWPCHVENCALHVTHLKVHELDAFHRDYIGPVMQRQIQKWITEETEEDTGEDPPVAQAVPEKRKGSLREDPRKRQSRALEQAPAGVTEKPKPANGEEKELSEDRKAELRRRLANGERSWLWRLLDLALALLPSRRPKRNPQERMLHHQDIQGLWWRMA